MADLSITITDAVTINGYARGGTQSLSITGINDVGERTITVPTSEVTIYSTHATDVAGATYDKDLIKYSRVTNLDETNFVDLRITNENADEFVYRLYAGQSFILHSHVGSMNATENAGAGLPNGDIVSVDAQANTAAVQLDIFIASA